MIKALTKNIEHFIEMCSPTMTFPLNVGKSLKTLERVQLVKQVSKKGNTWVVTDKGFSYLEELSPLQSPTVETVTDKVTDKVTGVTGKPKTVVTGKPKTVVTGKPKTVVTGKMTGGIF